MDDRRPTRGRCPSSFSGDGESSWDEREGKKGEERGSICSQVKFETGYDEIKVRTCSRRNESLEINWIGSFNEKEKKERSRESEIKSCGLPLQSYYNVSIYQRSSTLDVYKSITKR